MQQSRRATMFVALAAVFIGFTPAVAVAQTEAAVESDADAKLKARADVLAEQLTEGLPCSATATADALERRLTDSLEQLSDLYAALEVVSATETYCADIRAAAARQRLFIARAAGEDFNRDANDTLEETSRALSFRVGPPPLNLVKRSAVGG